MHEMERLRKHLEQVLGEPRALTPVEHVPLPVYLARTYSLWRGRLVGEPVLFACMRRGAGDRSPKRLEADARALEKAAEGDTVVLVLPRIASHVRRRLIHARLPFIIPGRQLFVPTMGVDLQERDLTEFDRDLPHLEWAAQVTVLRHVLWRDVEERSLRSVARSIGYSAMTLSNVQRQLVATSIAEIEPRGRAHTLRFLAPPRETWQAVLPRLRSPVRRTAAIVVDGSLPPAPHAGLSALSRTTEIADRAIPTLALGPEHATAVEEGGALRRSPDPDAADALMEIWNYDPQVLAEGDSVDPLSLYLSVQGTRDARVEQAAESLLEQVAW